MADVLRQSSESPYPWETRRPGELTPMYLGRVLDWIGGLDDMPRRAREGHFDDFAAPPEVADGLELHRLVVELERRKGRLTRVRRIQVTTLIAAVKEGEFDATAEESRRWAVSAEGQATFRMLMEGR